MSSHNDRTLAERLDPGLASARALDAKAIVSVTAVFLDVGETLVDETRLWRLWAEWMGVSFETLERELRSAIEERRHHRTVFERLRPGFDVAAARAERIAAGWPPDLAGAEDVYPDAAPCLRRLGADGYRVGIAGNQPAGIEALRDWLPADIVASSGSWGVSKPSPVFFERVVEAAAVPAGQVAYVGDRLDNDVLPALEAGLVGVFLRRGPWGRVHATWPEADRAHIRIDGLAELPAALARFDGAAGLP